MGNRLAGKSAVVTGSGRGIGRAVAMLIASEGAKVVVNDPGVNVDGTGHDNGPADQVVDEIRKAGGTAIPNYDSVATMQGGENMVKAALDNFGRIDILINVAGILRDRMIFNMAEAEWDDVIAVHLKGQFATIKPASILMRQQRYGRIINFSSGAGLSGNSGQANYGAAKAGVVGLTRVVARDLGRYGVTCNAIAPGAATRMTATIPDTAYQARAARGIAGAGTGAPPAMQGRTPEHVAPMVAFLCTDEAWDINGKVFHVAGGTVGLALEETPARTIIKQDMWDVEELVELVPQHLMANFVNPAPPPPELDIPGRPVSA